jgi:hypothetical protein
VGNRPPANPSHSISKFIFGLFKGLWPFGAAQPQKRLLVSNRDLMSATRQIAANRAAADACRRVAGHALPSDTIPNAARNPNNPNPVPRPQLRSAIFSNLCSRRQRRVPRKVLSAPRLRPQPQQSKTSSASLASFRHFSETRVPTALRRPECLAKSPAARPLRFPIFASLDIALGTKPAPGGIIDVEPIRQPRVSFRTRASSDT